MKFLKLHGFKIICAIMFVILTIYVCFFGISKQRNHEVYSINQGNLKIYSVLHIETFEGGGKSRAEFLKEIAKKLEKQHKGILFIIKTIDANEISEFLSTSTPDIISFGQGVGDLVLPFLKEINSTEKIENKFLSLGKFNNKTYAVPYILSGYSFITQGNSQNEIFIGKSQYLNTQNLTNNYKAITEKPSQYEAYKSFVNNKTSNLIGTARDVYRVTHLQAIGRISASITPINNYTNLVQYIGTTNNDKVCNEFINHAISDEMQIKLKDYSLFSTKFNNLYTEGIYSDMEDAFWQCETENVF